MSDENRDHRCRTCEHWGAPYVNKPRGQWICSAPIPFFAEPTSCEVATCANDGDGCGAYLYSYRRARLVRT